MLLEQMNVRDKSEKYNKAQPQNVVDSAEWVKYHLYIMEFFLRQLLSCHSIVEVGLSLIYF